MSKKMGRPIIPIDWEKVDSMCAIQCTGEEQAGVLGVTYNLLNRACKREKGVTFREYFRVKGANGKMSLRRKQYSTAMSGNATMLIWLGKNWLGQLDKSEVFIDAIVEEKQQQPVYEIIGEKLEDEADN